MAFSSSPRPAIVANLALAAVLAVVLSGCVAAPPQPTVSTTAADASGPRVEVNADGLLAVFAPRTDLSLQARLGGELIELEGGCIGVADGSASGALVLWPSTARLVGGGDRVRRRQARQGRRHSRRLRRRILGMELLGPATLHGRQLHRGRAAAGRTGALVVRRLAACRFERPSTRRQVR